MRLRAAGIVSGGLFGADRIIVAETGIGIASVAAFGAGLDVLVTRPPGIVSLELFGGDRVIVATTGSAIVSGGALGTGDVIRQLQPEPPGIDSGEGFGDPAIVTAPAGGVQEVPGGVAGIAIGIVLRALAQRRRERELLQDQANANQHPTVIVLKANGIESGEVFGETEIVNQGELDAIEADNWFLLNVA